MRISAKVLLWQWDLPPNMIYSIDAGEPI